MKDINHWIELDDLFNNRFTIWSCFKHPSKECEDDDALFLVCSTGNL